MSLALAHVPMVGPPAPCTPQRPQPHQQALSPRVPMVGPPAHRTPSFPIPVPPVPLGSEHGDPQQDPEAPAPHGRSPRAPSDAPCPRRKEQARLEAEERRKEKARWVSEAAGLGAAGGAGGGGTWAAPLCSVPAGAAAAGARGGHAGPRPAQRVHREGGRECRGRAPRPAPCAPSRATGCAAGRAPRQPCRGAARPCRGPTDGSPCRQEAAVLVSQRSQNPRDFFRQRERSGSTSGTPLPASPVGTRTGRCPHGGR